jgi:hypothetical protein
MAIGSTMRAFVLVCFFSVQVHGADSADALTTLTAIGYMTGAADGCKVVA